MIAAGNLLSDIPTDMPAEIFTELLAHPGIKIERILSRGHASPPGFWYDQDWSEWILLLAGAARLSIQDEPAPRVLGPGDFLYIPAHRRHLVEWTDPDQPTIWLAVHHP